MSEQKFSSGDRVRHAGRPEWGIGTITKVESLPMNGQASQRVSIRFPNAGVKTLVTGQGHSLLQRADEAHDPLGDGQPQSVKAWDKMKDSGWLAPMAKRKVEEAMITLPMEVRDPFNSLQKRLTLTMGLYRFDRSGRGVIDWAVAQTGLDDPLTRFTRHELEQKFDRWSFERDQHLAKLIHEIRNSGELAIIQAAMKSAPPAAQDVVRRLTNGR
ncbi:MAG: DUF3553 domain-containing protein [Phycisphaerales bacterium]|nr:DUF3553 domain-containing protein [Phycisphaerales bacterium]MCI0675490.1 DUF3553 domain-containing protein [Phycisphaerales bacterium]